MGDCVDPSVGLDDGEKRISLTSLGLEPRSLGRQSPFQLRDHCPSNIDPIRNGMKLRSGLQGKKQRRMTRPTLADDTKIRCCSSTDSSVSRDLNFANSIESGWQLLSWFQTSSFYWLQRFRDKTTSPSTCAIRLSLFTIFPDQVCT
jgi:hypothetical protein